MGLFLFIEGSFSLWMSQFSNSVSAHPHTNEGGMSPRDSIKFKFKIFIDVKTLQFCSQSIQTEQEIVVRILLSTYMCWGYDHLTTHDHHISEVQIITLRVFFL